MRLVPQLCPGSLSKERWVVAAQKRAHASTGFQEQGELGEVGGASLGKTTQFPGNRADTGLQLALQCQGDVTRRSSQCSTASALFPRVTCLG